MPSFGTNTVGSDVLFVLGAGVDVALGLPVMNNLLAELARFSESDGKKVDVAIRSHVKHMHFGIARYAGEQGEQLGERLMSSHAHLLPKLKSALTKHPDHDSGKVKAMLTVLENIQALNHANQLDSDTVKELSEIAGEKGTQGGDTLFSTRGWNFTPSPRQAMRKMFQGVLDEVSILDVEERRALEEVVSIAYNFEEMLGEFFSGFFTNNQPAKKKYFYLSWLLWAYIRHKAQAGKRLRDRSFYRTLSEVGVDAEVITFNYTNFFCDATCPKDGYFHGDCDSYIRFDSRQYIACDDAIRRATTVEGMAEFIGGLDVDWKEEKVFIPAIVPPVTPKPVICTEYLERWYGAAVEIQKARRIVAVGYSFNDTADGHFNDLIRKGFNGKRLFVMNPGIEPVVEQVCRILGYDKRCLSAVSANGFDCQRGGQLMFVNAKAEDISPEILLRLLES